MSRQVLWTYAFVDRPIEHFAPACEFWTAVTDTCLSELRGEHKEITTLLHDGADACVKVQGVASGPVGAHLVFPVADAGEVTADPIGHAQQIGRDALRLDRDPRDRRRLKMMGPEEKYRHGCRPSHLRKTMLSAGAS